MKARHGVGVIDSNERLGGHDLIMTYGELGHGFQPSEASQQVHEFWDLKYTAHLLFIFQY